MFTGNSSWFGFLVYSLYSLNSALILYNEMDWLYSLIKAMIIIAWNDTGNLGSVFDGDVFKKVLSIFITAAILKLAQGR